MDFIEDLEYHEDSLANASGGIESGGWQNLVTVGDVIDRGRKLRDAKPKKSDPFPYPGGSEIMKLDFVAPPCIPLRKYKRKSTYTKNKRINRKKLKKLSKEKPKSSPCTVRIAELAVPTKRACVENWKKNFHILPVFMIERLRKIVIDQAPVVQIKDAYGSFRKRKKPKSLRKKHKKYLEKCSIDNKADVEQLKKECKSCIHYLSALFGHKVYTKLLRPLNVGQCNQVALKTSLLNRRTERYTCWKVIIRTNVEDDDCPLKRKLLFFGGENQLGYLYNTVAEEIHLLMQPVKVGKSEVEKYNKFHDEISRTVAIWIRLVLRDTCDKILEEQLKELEEEEGPVLDFLDALLDNVLNICTPLTLIEEDDDQIIDLDEADTVTINTNDFCVQEIVKVLENILEEDTNTQPVSSNLSELLTDNGNEIPVMDDMNVDDIADPNEAVNDNTDFYEDAQSSSVPLDYDEDNENVSEIRLTSRDDVDYENKGILNKFSNNVTFGENLSENASKRPSYLNIGNKKKQFLSWASDTSLPKAISSAPNAELLREVNEKWPDNLSPGALIKTTSLIKSDTKLGNIGEIEDEISLLNEHGSTFCLKGSLESLEIDQSTSKHYYKKQEKGTESNKNKAKTHDIDTASMSKFGTEDKAKAHDIGKNLKSEFDTRNKAKTHDIITVPMSKFDKENKSRTPGILTVPISEFGAEDKAKTHNIGTAFTSTFDTEYKPKTHDIGTGFMSKFDTEDEAKTHDTGTVFMSKFDKEDKSVNTIAKGRNTSAIQTQSKDYKLKYGDRNTSVTDLYGYLDKKLSVINLGTGYLSQNKVPRDIHSGHGDLHDVIHSNEKVTREVVYDNDNVPHKLNLKVDMKSAPSWLKWYEEENKRGSLSQKVARQWCEDLQYTVKSMEEVNNWIQKTSQSILRIQHRKELKRCCPLKCKQRVKDKADLENMYITSTCYEKHNLHLKTLLVNHRSKYPHKKRSGENWACNCRTFLKSLNK